VRSPGEARDPVDVEGGGENRAGLHHFVKLSEHGFLDTHLLEHTPSMIS
jgi:hypothetical protein